MITDQIPSWMPGWRRFKDRAATVTVSAGGAGVLVAILLIFFYLVYEVLPLFGSAEIERRAEFQFVVEAPLYTAVEEQGEIALAITAAGRAEFFDTSSGRQDLSVDLDGGSDLTLDLVVEERPENRLLALVYDNGDVLLAQHQYRLTYPDDVRVITPRIEYPYGEEPLRLQVAPYRLQHLALRDSEEALTLVGQTLKGEVLVKRWVKEENFLTGEIELEEEVLRLPVVQGDVAGLHISVDQRWIYQVMADGSFRLWDTSGLSDGDEIPLADSGTLFKDGSGVSTSTMLLGGISLLAASKQGELVQFFVVRDGDQGRLQYVRNFETDNCVITQIIPEHRRKGFLGIDDTGRLQIFHSTARRNLLRDHIVAAGSAPLIALAPRADALVVLGEAGTVANWEIDNKHPDISWSALWEKVWYESYPEPDYIWQSSASNNDFEPKLSFSPLAFGTLKAAFYAMLIAAPLAICGAIYTAYFLAPALRRKIKPLIELMEALPTVILGFLAGLWLAPYVEANLTGVFTLLLVMPIGVLLFAFAWSRMPLGIRTLVPDGWHAAILVPVVCLLGYLSFAVNDQMELLLFGGDMRAWITTELGIPFDQRNALVVGIAMGLAVIPTIFSISEDAIFSVPKHLTYGSLALGATPWQTLVGVVMPTASPGIFSGLMIGMGRAVGETMIVLMATGNTPIMDANIFEGMRTLAANIAVEVPEAEVDSTHYRVLFLAAFVLFMFTFIVNTLAEIVRQRLRIKYGSL